ncbi:hypothetical protein VNO78_19549 [Psophocarpus tetragonolobus]|uniref:GH18 domain-containing protein n=1 Tax=Psophocarpus tetragonolobus TaxID=3891 RepID=A0AAN9S7Q1_PSOTE
MALNFQVALTLSLSLTLCFLTLSLGDKRKIAVYWGQEAEDGTLASTCESRNYDIVLLSFLDTFGCSRSPNLNLDVHCGVKTGTPCTRLQTEIERCKRRDVKVLLALGGPTPSYSLCSASDAKVVATYLYSNFLSAQNGPLGFVSLDGIHFDIQFGSKSYWEDLVQELNHIKERDTGSSFILSAAPSCFLPDPFLDEAIKTGNFDDIFIGFYNTPVCQYSAGDASSLLDTWIANIDYNASLFMELPASPDATSNVGYIEPANLVDQIIKFVKESSSFAGVALWDKSRDVKSLYSNQIKSLLSYPQTNWHFLQSLLPME